MSPEAKIEIGSGCGFSGVSLSSAVRVTLGNNVRAGANVIITDTDWHSGDLRVGPPRPVWIGDDVWIGTGAIILKGAHIGKNSLIGAGSVVTGEIPDNCIAAGNPVRIIRSFAETDYAK